MKYRHLFFDLDHTLWDFEKNSTETLKEIYELYKLSEVLQVEVNQFVATYQKINHAMWEQYRIGLIEKSRLRTDRFYNTLSTFNSSITPQLANDIGLYYVEHSPQKTALFPYAIDVLDYLKNRGYQLHIITNGFEEVQHVKLEKSGLVDFVQQVITSEKAGVKKPERQIFEYALRETNAGIADSLMIGDSFEADIRGAAELGMHQAYFCPNKQWVGGKGTYNISQLNELKFFL